LYHFTVMFNPAFHAAILNKPLIDCCRHSAARICVGVVFYRINVAPAAKGIKAMLPDEETTSSELKDDGGLPLGRLMVSHRASLSRFRRFWSRHQRRRSECCHVPILLRSPETTRGKIAGTPWGTAFLKSANCHIADDVVPFLAGWLHGWIVAKGLDRSIWVTVGMAETIDIYTVIDGGSVTQWGALPIFRFLSRVSSGMLTCDTDTVCLSVCLSRSSIVSKRLNNRRREAARCFTFPADATPVDVLSEISSAVMLCVSVSCDRYFGGGADIVAPLVAAVIVLFYLRF